MSKAICERCGASADIRRADGILTASWAPGARTACQEMKDDPGKFSLLSQCPSMARALAGAGSPETRQRQGPAVLKRSFG